MTNKGADQPAHPRSLISAFVICLLESILYNPSKSEISIFLLVSVAEQAGFGYDLITNPEYRFSHVEAHLGSVKFCP